MEVSDLKWQQEELISSVRLFTRSTHSDFSFVFILWRKPKHQFNSLTVQKIDSSSCILLQNYKPSSIQQLQGGEFTRIGAFSEAVKAQRLKAAGTFRSVDPVKQTAFQFVFKKKKRRKVNGSRTRPQLKIKWAQSLPVFFFFFQQCQWYFPFFFSNGNIQTNIKYIKATSLALSTEEQQVKG